MGIELIGPKDFVENTDLKELSKKIDKALEEYFKKIQADVEKLKAEKEKKYNNNEVK